KPFEDDFVQQKCSECEEDQSVQSKNSGTAAPQPNFESTLASTRGKGSKMDDTTKTRMDSGFGTDFSNVRIHTGSTAVQMNQNLGSQAFATGNDIYFNQGKYSPGSKQGDHLLAHELTHTIQQGAVPALGIQKMPNLTTKHYKGNYNLNMGKPTTLQAFDMPNLGIGDALLDGADFIADTAGDAVDFAGEVVGDVIEMGADALMEAIRYVSPQLADLIEEGPLKLISEALNGGIQAWLAQLFGGLGIGELISGLKENFASVFEMIKGVVTGDEAACTSFNKMIESIREFISGFMDNPFFQAISEAFNQISGLLSQVFDAVVAPVLDFVMDLVGDALSGLKELATTIWGWIKDVKDYMVAAWEYVMEALGFTGDGEGGIWEWIKGIASDVWDSIKETFAPVIGPLRTILSILIVLSPVGPVIIAMRYGPSLVAAIQWLWANKDNPNIVTDAKEQMGHTILPQLLEQGQGFITQISDVVAGLLGTFTELYTAVLEFIGTLTGIPLLDYVAGFIQSVSEGINSFITWGQTALTEAIAFLGSIFEKVKNFVQPVIEIITSIGLAILNPPMIPIMLMGWAWRMLPDCYKPPIIDFLLDGIIAFMRALPSFTFMGPLWMLLKPFI
ncbi:MAG: eCIS core domain-containing protein, partial [Marinirhabdus sp.]